MSHFIDQTTERDAIAYVGDTPWHGLGQRLTEDAPLETWVIEAGLGYEVKRAPLVAMVNGVPVTVPNRDALYRADTGALLGGYVSQNCYRERQPKDMVEFFRDLLPQGFRIDVAGALSGGATVWALARNKNELRIRGNDVVVPYLLASDDFTGSRSTEFQFTTVRVVCNNTLQMAYRDSDGVEVGKVSVPHSKHLDITNVHSRLGLLSEASEQFHERASKFAERMISEAEASYFVSQLFAKYTEDNELTTNSKNTMAQVVQAIKQSPGSSLKSADGTLWGLLNGVTYFVDHQMRAQSVDNRLNNAWFGRGAELKSKAESLATQLLAA